MLVDVKQADPTSAPPPVLLSCDSESKGFVTYYRPHLTFSDVTVEAVSGELHVNAMRVRGLSRLPTARVVDAVAHLGSGVWYYEALLLSDGPVQIGWGSVAFRSDQDQVRCRATVGLRGCCSCHAP